MARRARSIKSLALEFLQHRLGEICTRSEIEEFVRDHRGGSAGEVTRRVRELRRVDGWAIETHLDAFDLSPGQYRLVSLEREAGPRRSVSQKTAYEVWERDGYTCQSCGLGAGEPDPNDLTRKIRLHIDHIVPQSAWHARDGDWNELDNLRALCSNCNAGKKAFFKPSKPAMNLLEVVRAMPRSTQREVYEVLRNKFAPAEASTRQAHED